MASGSPSLEEAAHQAKATELNTSESSPEGSADRPSRYLPQKSSRPLEGVPEDGSQFNGPFRRNTFGIKKSNEPMCDPIAASHDYTLKYKEDPLFHELDENARVWFVYNDEANVLDSDMVGEAADNLDILLVFAGLFSAVATTFVVQTAQALAPDDPSLSVSLLKELVDLQRAQASGMSFDSIPPARAVSSPSGIDLWVNGLWFTSLAFSLASALLAVLAKQWLRQFRSVVGGTTREQALTRQFRFTGLEKWHVRAIIGFLPTFLHVSLILFLIGLVLFLSTLNTAIASVVGAITFALLTVYVVSQVLPLFYLQCPYRTPLTEILYHLRQLRGLSGDIKSEERTFVQEWGDFGTGEPEALYWLARTSTNLSARKVVGQSLAALSPAWVDSKAITNDPNSNAWRMAALNDYSFWFWISSMWLHDIPSDLREVLQAEGGKDCRFLTQDQKRTMQRGLIGGLHAMNVSDVGWTRPQESAGEYRVLKSDLGLALTIMAGGDNVLLDEDDGSSVTTVRLSSHEGFSWIVDNYDTLNIPDLPPIVWKRLKEESQWTYNDTRNAEKGPGAGTAKLKEDCLATAPVPAEIKDWPPHGAVSFLSFIKPYVHPIIYPEPGGAHGTSMDPEIGSLVIPARESRLARFMRWTNFRRVD